MTKFALITDTHAGIRNDSVLFYNYQNNFYQNVFFPYLKEHNIKNIIHLGDFFDKRKEVNFKTFKNIKESFLNKLEEYDIKMFLILGNHDVVLKNTNHINSPSLLLKQYKNIDIVDSPLELKIGSKYSSCIIPWINNENQEEYLKFISNSTSEVCIGHFDIKNCLMNKTQKSDYGLDPNMFDKFIHTFSGHFHIKSKYNGIQYLGSPFQFDWNDYGDIRGFHIFDGETLDIEFIKNPDSVFRKIEYISENNIVFDCDKLENIKDCYVKIICSDPLSLNKDRSKFEQFIEKIQKHNPFSLEVINPNIILNEENIEEEITNSIGELVSDSQTIMFHSIDKISSLSEDQKNITKKIFTELYYEAIS